MYLNEFLSLKSLKIRSILSTSYSTKLDLSSAIFWNVKNNASVGTTVTTSTKERRENKNLILESVMVSSTIKFMAQKVQKYKSTEKLLSMKLLSEILYVSTMTMTQLTNEYRALMISEIALDFDRG
mmetsp:Transcript_14981/g.22305  ORF Transcript_14981/g.22305 Transcript_14981/m.22305 type:complete len:126 (-) Transcript_14981:47-424(-)